MTDNKKITLSVDPALFPFILSGMIAERCVSMMNGSSPSARAAMDVMIGEFRLMMPAVAAMFSSGVFIDMVAKIRQCKTFAIGFSKRDSRYFAVRVDGSLYIATEELRKEDRDNESLDILRDLLAMFADPDSREVLPLFVEDLRIDLEAYTIGELQSFVTDEAVKSSTDKAALIAQITIEKENTQYPWAFREQFYRAETFKNTLSWIR